MRLRINDEVITPTAATTRRPRRSAMAPKSGCSTDELKESVATNSASVSSLASKRSCSVGSRAASAPEKRSLLKWATNSSIDTEVPVRTQVWREGGGTPASLLPVGGRARAEVYLDRSAVFLAALGPEHQRGAERRRLFAVVGEERLGRERVDPEHRPDHLFDGLETCGPANEHYGLDASRERCVERHQGDRLGDHGGEPGCDVGGLGCAVESSHAAEADGRGVGGQVSE